MQKINTAFVISARFLMPKRIIDKGNVGIFLLVWLAGVLVSGDGRQLKYLQFNSLVSSSFNSLTEKEKKEGNLKSQFTDYLVH